MTESDESKVAGWQAKLWERDHQRGAWVTAKPETIAAAGYAPASRLLAVEAELKKAPVAAARRIGELEEAITDVADGFEQQGKHGLAGQLRQFLPAAAPPVAPSSPPVAPEPAQETKRCSVNGCPHSAMPGKDTCAWHSPDDDTDDECDPVNGESVSATVGKPAQENQECPNKVCHQYLLVGARCRCGFQHRTSSGEAAGDGVTHHESAVTLQAIAETHSPAGQHYERLEKLELYRQQQEQSEREAAGLRERLALVEEERDFLRGDRDAERTQKEAALNERAGEEALWVELEACERLHAQANVEIGTRDADIAALRAENEGLKARLDAANAICRVRLAALNHANDGRVLLRCHDCDELTFVNHDCLAAQQPTEAAPVAKLCCCGHRDDNHVHGSAAQDGYCGKCACRRYQEAAPVAKAEAPSEGRKCPLCGLNPHSLTCMYEPTRDPLTEAPSEPAGWVARVGDKVRVRDTGGGHDGWKGSDSTIHEINADGLVTLDNPKWGTAYAWSARELELIEPAPQPPATTGDDRPVMLGELLAALEKLVNRGGIILPDSPSSWFGKLAEELERRKP